ncbi:MAG: Nif3-like dinuclear metal center hexameric protein [Flavobacteriales bacterium]|nr:Nif3-like dinuclear metal center hexameric protein [Flavobacteriales bacterium]MCW8913002.1 Nif3-like dinuclear metal center hexameric protein [Flavobacteriales bacterium]MCW8938602.1 Nif3-like dinuclear metal center hexameric protein [Flavobacteriales bacterium]MCW8969359.1 Nif3-like dinuclear metal center hexameric protein [Flavobacteriales bacterium]MCW8989003.1 Nif3-like dinuclear metal center hexameric protein [Flavobacteriales bacterium]
MLLKEIIAILEGFAPLSLQENYDNSGLIVGNANDEITAALICLDSTEEIVDEAIAKGCNLIIAHHPILFSGIKKLNGNNYIERVIIKAIKNNIAIYASHTNLDNAYDGVSYKIAEKLGLTDCKTLSPKNNMLKKIVTFCPVSHVEKVRNAMFSKGAGKIGEYSSCSFNSEGVGTFKGNDNTQPFIGAPNELHYENELKIETIAYAYQINQIISAMIASHPYEEVAYDIYPLENKDSKTGSGVFGKLPTPIKTKDFLLQLKMVMKTNCIRHTKIIKEEIETIALCGGSGSFLLPDAKKAKADIFISGDFKYHQFFDADNDIVIADIGHYESEQFTSELIYDILRKKIPNFALHLSEKNTNPINYL